jgi:tRNA G18 (ribose-2'-O)-methylase SpoU
MPRILIHDLDDPRIIPYRHLKTTNETRHSDLFVVEGSKLLDRLIASPFPLVSVLVTDRYEARIAPTLPTDIPMYVVPHAWINAIAGFHYHQGVLACGRRTQWPGWDEVVERAGRRATIVVCPGLNNPENLGAIVRIGDVFGIDAVLVGCKGCPDPLSRRVLRVSMGAALRLPVIASEAFEQDVGRLRDEFGFELAATVVNPDAEPLRSVLRADRLALFLGNEAEGLDPEWVARCSRQITIPMRPGAESLNVAVATGILLYHLTSDIAFPTQGR